MEKCVERSQAATLSESLLGHPLSRLTLLLAPCWCHVLSSTIESGKAKSATPQGSQALPPHSLSFQCLGFKALNEHGNLTLKVMDSPSAMLCHDAEMYLLVRRWDFPWPKKECKGSIRGLLQRSSLCAVFLRTCIHDRECWVLQSPCNNAAVRLSLEY